MLTKFENSGTMKNFVSSIKKMDEDPSVKGILVLSCYGNHFDSGELDSVLQKIKKPLFGGIFPAILFEDIKYEKGTVFAGLTKKPLIQIIPNLSIQNEDYEKVIGENLSKTGKKKTMFVFVDGLSKRISSFIEALFNIFGLEMNYIGGGTGSLEFIQKPSIFSNKGLLTDSAIIALTDISSGIGVSHGWEKINGPFKVTESDRNRIISIDWEPAFKIYKKIVEEHSGSKITKSNFFDICKGYPLGINTLSDEKIIRDPVATDDGESLICVGEVPKDSYIDIMHGKKNSLIRAAGNALFKAKKELPGEGKIEAVIFIDCISRVLFLENEFWKELAIVQEPGAKIFGALTLGEIANNKKDYLEFLNKTSVVGVMGD